VSPPYLLYTPNLFTVGEEGEMDKSLTLANILQEQLKDYCVISVVQSEIRNMAPYKLLRGKLALSQPKSLHVQRLLQHWV